ncbi:MAG TPA: hypothetical protein VEY51_21135 [Chondromyces sp.]|nr:hypothetical protein [Chondromyces sp.]
MYEWILYDYYMRENEADEVTDLICRLLNINVEYKKEIFKQHEQKNNKLKNRKQ